MMSVPYVPIDVLCGVLTWLGFFLGFRLGWVWRRLAIVRRFAKGQGRRRVPAAPPRMTWPERPDVTRS